MKLYHGISSVCSIKVRLGLAEIGLPYDEIVLELPKGDQHDPAYLKINPDGVVPTLIDEDLTLAESSLILEYLDRRYNGSGLMPDDPKLEARARHLLLRCIAIHAAINTLTFSTAGREKTLAGKTPEQIQAMLARMPDPIMAKKREDLLSNGLDSVYLAQAMMHLDRLFSDMEEWLADSDWISGPEFGISDIAVLSYIDRLERLGFEGLWAERTPRVGEWLTRMQARPSYAAEISGRIDEEATRSMRASGGKYWDQVSDRWEALARA